MRIVIVLLLLSAVPFCNASEGYSCERQNGIKLTDLNSNSIRALFLGNSTFRNEIIGQLFSCAFNDLIAEEQHDRKHVIQQMEQNQWNSIAIKNKRGLEALLQEERSVIEGEDSDQVAIAQSQKRAERRKKREDEKFEKERATVISEESTYREAIVKAERTGAATIVKNFKSILKSIRRTAKNAQARKHAETSSVPLDPSTSTMDLPLQDTQVETKEKPYEETSRVPLDLSTSTMDLPLQDTQVETKEKPGVLIYRHNPYADPSVLRYRHNPYADPSTIYMWCSK